MLANEALEIIDGWFELHAFFHWHPGRLCCRAHASIFTLLQPFEILRVVPRQSGHEIVRPRTSRKGYIITFSVLVGGPAYALEWPGGNRSGLSKRLADTLHWLPQLRLTQCGKTAVRMLNRPTLPDRGRTHLVPHLQKGFGLKPGHAPVPLEFIQCAPRVFRVVNGHFAARCPRIGWRRRRFSARAHGRVPRSCSRQFEAASMMRSSTSQSVILSS